jgi:hypothetical protein
MRPEELAKEFGLEEPVRVALSVEQHDELRQLPDAYRAAIGSVFSPEVSEREVPCPPELMNLARDFATRSHVDVVPGEVSEWGMRFSYHADTPSEGYEGMAAQELWSELEALQIGDVTDMDIAGCVTLRIPLPDGSVTHWFFYPTAEPKAPRAFFAGYGGNRSYAEYHLSFVASEEGGAVYRYWPAAGRPNLQDVLVQQGAQLQAADDDTGEFSVLLNGQHCVFQVYDIDPEQLIAAGAHAEQRLDERIACVMRALPPELPGHIRVFRGIEAAYTPRLPLTDADHAELERLRQTYTEWAGDEAVGARFADLFMRSRAEMCTPNLRDVLQQYARSKSATLLYADVTPEEFERYRDPHAVSTIFSGYTTFPPGHIAWHSVQLADIGAEGR